MRAHMSHTIRDKQKLKARTSKIQGQVAALKKMLDEPHECAAVLQQIAAIRGAVNGLLREVDLPPRLDTTLS